MSINGRFERRCKCYLPGWNYSQFDESSTNYDDRCVTVPTANDGVASVLFLEEKKRVRYVSAYHTVAETYGTWRDMLMWHILPNGIITSWHGHLNNFLIGRSIYVPSHNISQYYKTLRLPCNRRRPCSWPSVTVGSRRMWLQPPLPLPRGLHWAVCGK